MCSSVCPNGAGHRLSPVGHEFRGRFPSFGLLGSFLCLKKTTNTTAQTIIKNRQRSYRTACGSELRTKEKMTMKHWAKVMSVLMALSGATVSGALAQTPPAQTPPAQPPPTTTQTQQQTQAKPQQNDHPKARGAAAGAVIGAATTGNAARGAVIGAGHNRREERRANRRNQ